jgi:peptidoglycan hydrolase-like protein with peptidoglycan-binding domain
VTPAIGLAILGGALLLASSRGGSAAANCDDTAEATAAKRERAALLAWIDCAGRTPADAAALAGLLDRAGRAADARAVRERWNARVQVDSSTPDGELEPTHAADAARALESPTPPATIPEAPARRRVTGARRAPGTSGGVDLTEARRLAPQVARSLRSGGGYRTALIRFQRAAGLIPDGLYGPASRAALAYFGVGDPPPARAALSSPEVYNPPGEQLYSVDPTSRAPEGYEYPTKPSGGGSATSLTPAQPLQRPATWERL